MGPLFRYGTVKYLTKITSVFLRTNRPLFFKKEKKWEPIFLCVVFVLSHRKAANLAAIVRKVCGGVFVFYFKSHIYSFSIVPGVDNPLHM